MAYAPSHEPAPELPHLQRITFAAFPSAVVAENLDFAQKVLAKASSWSGGKKADEIEILTMPRQPSGYIEWQIRFSLAGKLFYLLAAIQRSPQSEVEFHS